MGKTGKKGAAYTRAGVDIDAKMNALRAARADIRGTFTRGVVGDIGSAAVLSNDRSPAGLRIWVDAHLEYEPNPAVGTPFVTGNQVRRADAMAQEAIATTCHMLALLRGRMRPAPEAGA